MNHGLITGLAYSDEVIYLNNMLVKHTNILFYTSFMIKSFPRSTPTRSRCCIFIFILKKLVYTYICQTHILTLLHRKSGWQHEECSSGSESFLSHVGCLPTLLGTPRGSHHRRGRHPSWGEPRLPFHWLWYHMPWVEVPLTSHHSTPTTLPTPTTTTTTHHRQAIADKKVKAIILRVNSPGGSYTASDIIHREILRAQEKGKKVGWALVRELPFLSNIN